MTLENGSATLVDDTISRMIAPPFVQALTGELEARIHFGLNCGASRRGWWCINFMHLYAFSVILSINIDTGRCKIYSNAHG